MTPPINAVRDWPHTSFINIEGVKNVRDIGCYPVSCGVPVRRKLVYRSGYLDDLTEEGQLQIQKLGIKKIFDLRSFLGVDRSKKENSQYECWLASSNGPERIVVPVFRDEDFAPEALAVRFKDYASKGTEARSFSRIKARRLTFRRALRRPTIPPSSTLDRPSKPFFVTLAVPLPRLSLSIAQRARIVLVSSS